MTVDVEQRIHLNTAISALMELVNEMYVFSDAALKGTSARPQAASAMREAIEALVIMISPFAPHTAEECGNDGHMAASPGVMADI